jgi:putative ABC transport system substrate-binding protein
MRQEQMKRREFLAIVAGWPPRSDFALAGSAFSIHPSLALAQQPAPIIGVLSNRSFADSLHLLEPLRRGLAETGHVEGQNLIVEYRWSNGDYSSLPGLAADLIRQRVKVLVTTGGPPSALAAQAATSTTPIVFVTGGNPATMGIVASYSHPGGNATGVAMSMHERLESKRLELLHEMVPSASKLGFLINPAFPPAQYQVQDAQSAATAAGVTLEMFRASTDEEIEAALQTAAEKQVGGLAVASDPYFNTRATKLVALAARHAIPTIYEVREYVTAGGLASYGIDNREVWRMVGVYTGRILNGEAPASLPVTSPNKLEFVVNLKAANALGIALPPSVFARADEVIE